MIYHLQWSWLAFVRTITGPVSDKCEYISSLVTWTLVWSISRIWTILLKNDRMIHHKYKNNVHTLLNHNPLLLVVTLLFNIKVKVKILLPAGSEYGFPAPLPRRTVDSLGLSLLLKPAGKRNYKSYFYFFIHWHHGQHLHCIYFVIEVFFHIARVHSHGYCGVEKVQVKPDKDHCEDPFNI